MNPNPSEVHTLASSINPPTRGGQEVILCVPTLYIQEVQKYKTNNVHLGAQDCSAYPNGAHTGDISSAMLAQSKVSHVIIGHSERRKYHKEKDSELLKKINQAIQNELQIIFCVGESLEQRNGGKAFQHVAQQLQKTIFKLKSEFLKYIILAYEPVWAIGTGLSATPVQAQEMHALIRSLLHSKFKSEGSNVPIIYGGSCNPMNAPELFKLDDVDGGLIGGASLNADDFCKIIFSF